MRRKRRGTLAAVFTGKVTQSECQMMVTYLSKNNDWSGFWMPPCRMGSRIAHKHGWVAETDGVIHTMLDAGIVYGPQGNYVIVVAMYQPTQLIFDIGNYLFGQISRAAYNYFDIQEQ